MKLIIQTLFSAISALLLVAVAQPAHGDADRARELTQRFIIVDTHIDVPYRIEDQWADVSRATDDGDFDYPRAKAGGLDAPFMSIYIPAEMETTGGSYQLANQLIDSVEALVGRAPDRFALARSPDDVERNFEKGLISLPLGMENGAAIEGSLENLRHFHQRGIRYITLAHSKANHISDSSYDENRLWHGLSDFGVALVAEMNRLGVMVDISHLSDDAAAHVLEISQAPVIASHSSVRKFTEGWERNMNDELIQALANNGGVIQINFGSTFVSPEAFAWSQTFNERRAAFMEERGISDRGAPEVEGFSAGYREANPYPYANLNHVLDHFDHVVELVGIEHVGVGSDYDGVGDSLPMGLKDVSTYPNLVAGLLDRGYSESDIGKILGGNLLRVWREVEAFAAAH